MDNVIELDTNPRNTIDVLFEKALDTFRVGPDTPLKISFSGGKDSTVLGVIAGEAMKRGYIDPDQLEFITADTAIEIPALEEQVYRFLHYMRDEFGCKVTIVKRDPKRSYWSRFLGEGTFASNHFARWCVRDLKINPIKQALPEDDNYVMAIGIRLDESVERGKRYEDKVKKTTCDTAGECFAPMEDEPRIFPLLEWKNCNIWDFLMFDERAQQYPVQELQELYFQRDTMRYGCWNCTVARDTELLKLHGWKDPRYKLLLKFRNLQEEYTTSHKHPEDWIYVWREPGPRNTRLEQGVKTWMASRLTVETRKRLLKYLLAIQDITGFNLISEEEVRYIKSLWEGKFKDGDTQGRKWRYWGKDLENIVNEEKLEVLSKGF